MMHIFHRCDSVLASRVSLYPSCKYSPTYEDILMQEIINNSLKNPLPKDEFLMNHVDPSPKMYLHHEDILVQDDNIINTFLNAILPFMYLNDIVASNESMSDIVDPSPKVFPTHDDILE